MKKIFKTTLTVAALSAASFGTANAAGAVGVNHTFNGGGNQLTHTKQSLTQTVASSDLQAYTSNPNLDGASWGHFGSWYTFHSHTNKRTTITATGVVDGNIPGFTVWRTDGQFDGGTGSTGELSSANKGTPHSFNQVGSPGDYGTWWMTDNSLATSNSYVYDADGPLGPIAPVIKNVGNTASGILDTVGYANDGATQTNGWGATVNTDANSGDGIASLTFNALQHGDYLIFVGGADGLLSGGDISLVVSQVPVPAAAYLFGTALLGLAGASRRKSVAA